MWGNPLPMPNPLSANSVLPIDGSGALLDLQSDLFHSVFQNPFVQRC